MEEADVHGAGRIADSDVKDGAAAAFEADGGPSSACDFSENRLHLAGDYFGDGGEAEAVFVAEREIAEEIADGDDAASFESGGTLRAYAVEVFHRVGERDGHQSLCWFCAGGCTTFIPSVAVAEVRLHFARECVRVGGERKEEKTLNSGRGLERIRSEGQNSAWAHCCELGEVARAVQSVEMLRN